MTAVLKVCDLSVVYPIKGKWFGKKKYLTAVDQISFELRQGEVLGVVGESGCGKSSLARALVGLNKISSGDAILLDRYYLSKVENWIDVYKEMQFIFQDPIAALNPRMTVLDIITEPLKINHPNLTRHELQDKAVKMMLNVGLNSAQINRYPQEFSGGQCQRIGIARALIMNPKILICDESVSALDVSIKAQIINLLIELKEKFNLSIIFISHDLGIVRHISDRVLVMYKGQLVELASSEQLFANPQADYTRQLLSAVLDVKTTRQNRE